MIKNILVTIDFRENFVKLIETAAMLAEKFNSSIWLLHCAMPDEDFVSYDSGPQYIRELRAEQLKKEHRNLQEQAQKLEQRGIQAEGLLIAGATTEMILHESAKLKIDLVVMGHESHGFFYRVFMENTSQQVINKSKVPVLVVPYH